MKLRYLLVLLLLLLPACTESDAMTTMMLGGGVASAGLDAGCQAGATFTYNTNHTSGTNYACDSAGAPLEGTLEVATIHDGYLDAPTVNDYIVWTVDSSEISSAAGTLYISVYFDDTGDAAPNSDLDSNEVFEFYYDANNYIDCRSQDTGENLTCRYMANGTEAEAVIGDFDLLIDTWYRIGYTWSIAVTDHELDHAVSAVACDGADCTGLSEVWEEDTNELIEDFTTEATTIVIGEKDLGYMYDDMWATDVMVLDGYMTPDPF